MDANYLKINVFDALTEALTAMAIEVPDDKVEYIGKYLLTYVTRRKFEKEKEIQRHQIEKDYSNEVQSQTLQQSKLNALKAEEDAHLNKLPKFLDSLKSIANTKQIAMDRSVNFINDFLNIPGVYIAIKMVQKGETDIETLNYFSACVGQEFVIGKQITNQFLDNDGEIIPKSGISFEAFKVPILEEESVNEDEEVSVSSKPLPKPEPLIIENVMRNQRVKFFGIPKLGYYVAIPFSYESIDHDNGLVPKTNDDENNSGNPDENSNNENSISKEEGEEVEKTYDDKYAKANITPRSFYTINKITQEFIIGVDTIGKYRVIKQSEIDIIKSIGQTLISVFENIENKQIEAQKQFYSKYPNISKQVNDILSSIVDAEAKAVAALTPAPPASTEDQNVDGANEEANETVNELKEDNESVEPVPELESLKPFLESQAIISVWNKLFTNDSIVEAIGQLEEHILPINTQSLHLFYVISLLLGYSSKDILDVCSNLSWSTIRQKIIPTLTIKITDYNILNEGEILQSNKIKFIKSYIEKNNVYDTTNLPSYIPVLLILVKWVEKAIIARENAIIYIKESQNRDIEK